MGNRTIEAVLRMSAKLGNMRAFDQMATKLDQVDKKVKAFNRSQSVIATTAVRAQRAMVGGIASYGAVRGVSALVTDFAEAERRLNRIAVNADASKERLGDMFRVVDRLAQDYAMSQGHVVDGLDALVAAGRNVDEALAFLPSVAATAQASGSEIADIATTGDAVAASFGIAGDRMQKAFDILVASGKQGKFELKDMAQYVPTIAPAFAALGYRGEKGLTRLAAMLQTVRMRTGGASEAATALQNVIQKMNSNETANSFKKFGVDLRRELEKARREGRDLVDVFVDLTEKATGGDLSKIPQLFTDSEFQVGMRALMLGRQDMEGFQAALATVDGSTVADLNRILSDSQADVDRLAASWDHLKKTIGSGIAGPATASMNYVSANMDKAQYINTQLERDGMGWWGRRMWWANNGFDERAQGLKAYKAGWRSPEGFLAAKGPMSASPELPSRRQDQGSSYPIPTPRPVPLTASQQYSLYGRGHAAAVGQGAFPAPSADDRGFLASAYDDLMRPVGSLGVAEELKRGGVETAASIVDGGKQAGQGIKAGADSLSQAGQDIKAAIVSGAEHLASAVSRAAGDLMRPVGSLRSGAVRADTGVSKNGRAE